MSVWFGPTTWCAQRRTLFWSLTPNHSYIVTAYIYLLGICIYTLLKRHARQRIRCPRGGRRSLISSRISPKLKIRKHDNSEEAGPGIGRIHWLERVHLVPTGVARCQRQYVQERGYRHANRACGTKVTQFLSLTATVPRRSRQCGSMSRKPPSPCLWV